MSILKIENFSCLRAVEFEVAPVTVLIGPQGSGKSLIAKLNYFFGDLLRQHLDAAANGSTVDDFKSATLDRFFDWFPSSSWGNQNFKLSFTAGVFDVAINRNDNTSPGVEMVFSTFFESYFSGVVDIFAGLKNTIEESTSNSIGDSLHNMDLVREMSDQIFAEALGREFVYFQNFIPSGRAVFTSMGQIAATLTRENDLEPLTVTFAKLFSRLRALHCRAGLSLRSRRRGGEIDGLAGDILDELFGGFLSFSDLNEGVVYRDSRLIPLRLLSSGSQELLPIFLIARLPFSQEKVREKFGRSWLYIEEPEAHLFPAAQSLLMDFLISETPISEDHTELILTTHSPYILTKLNNFLKAGMLARDPVAAEKIAAIIPRRCWLTPDRVRVYGIDNGLTKNLIDDDGLIDGSYIDGVSEEIARTFGELLDIEFAETAS